MARNTTRNYRSDSHAATHLRTLHGVPTPWMETSWIEPYESEAKPERHVHVKFRFWVRKRGRTLHLETHADSPSYPGFVKPILLRRVGTIALHVSASRLVTMSKLDPSSAPAQPRYRWDRQHKDFMQGREIATAAALQLYRFLNPRRGRPAGWSPKDDASPATMPGLPVALRAKRREEILGACTRMQNILDPLLDRVHDARRMRGYDASQRNEIIGHTMAIERSVKLLRRVVFNDKFEQAMTSAKAMSADEVLNLSTPSGNLPQQPAPALHQHDPAAQTPFTLDDIEIA